MIAVAQNERKLASSADELPFSYQFIEITSGSRPIGFRFSKSITDISAILNGRKILVCGEDQDHGISFAKAHSELAERSALLTYGMEYGAKTSNGWAAHPDFDCTRANAIQEIIERDAVLAQWYSKTPFLEIPERELPLDIQAWAQVELRRSEFPFLKLLVSTMGFGPSVTCILMNKIGFGVSAHATKETLVQSINAAIAEACRAAHLSFRRSFWKDTLKLKEGNPGRVDPSAHSLFYAYHEKFPEWIFGNFHSFNKLNADWRFRLARALADKQFSFEQVMERPLYVGYASHPLAFELRWQTTDLELVSREMAFHRLNITKDEINTKPHIIS